MTLRMERRDTRISGPRTHSACDGPGAVPLLLYARPSLGPQPRALWSAARISAAAPRAPAGSHSVTNMQRSKSFVSGSDGSHRSCRYVIVCCRMPTGAGPGPRHCQPESRRLPPLSRPSQSMPVTSGAYGGQRRSAVSAPRSALSELPRRCERQRPARAEQPLEAKPLKGAIKLEVDLEIGAAAERASPARRPARTHPRQHVCEPDRQVVEPNLAGARRCRRPSADAEAELRHVGLHAQAERLDLHLQRDCVELDQPRALVWPDVRRERAEHLADRVADLVELILDRVPPFVGALVSAAEQLCLAELNVGVAEVVPHDLHRSEPPVLAAFARCGRQRSVETLHVLTHHPTEHGCVEAAEIVAVELIRRWRRRRRR
mmetsp:Transcript_28401/g.83964  ORF Transcript_28401/g.83964 Transcript_28401/m.83964 type:complete len:375 (+) Transcript_28401:249-1373(+)